MGDLILDVILQYMVSAYFSCFLGVISLGPIADISVMASPYAYGNLYGGFNTRRYTLVHGFFLKLFLWALKS